MKIPLTIFCAVAAAIPSLRAATSAELLEELKSAASAELKALRKVTKGPAQDQKSMGLSSALTQVETGLADESGSPSSLVRSVSALQASSSSEKVQNLAKALVAQLSKEALANRDAEIARLDAVGKRCAQQWLAAKTASDLDGPLAELNQAMGASRYAREVFASGGNGTLSSQLAALSALLQNRQDYFLKMDAGEKRQALAALRQRSSSGDAVLVWVPRSLIVETAQRDRKAALPGIENVEATFRTLGEKVFAAQTAKDIDPLIAELGMLNENVRTNDDGSEGRNATVVQSTLEFARRWQDFLAARAAGNLEKARTVLSELTGYGRDYPGIARSEILARAYGEEIGVSGGKKPAKTVSVLASPEQILSNIKTLDDLDRLLPDFTAATSSDRGGWSGMANDLQSLARSYRDLRAGNSSRVSLGLSGSESREPVATLRGQLALFALPRILGVADADRPGAEENTLTYLRRMITLARERKDWQFASRILSAIQTAQVSDPLLKTSDSTALSSFLAGLNLEKGRQFSLAVNSFQIALKTGSDFIPAEEIGEHLVAIKRDYPADYEAGMQLTLTPPAPATDPFGRSIQTRGMMLPGNPYSTVRPGANPPDSTAKEKSVPVPAKAESIEPVAKPAPPAPEPKKE